MFEKLDHKKIIAVIEPEYLHRLSYLEILDTIDSTNSYLLRRTKEQAPSGSVCFAEEQTQGRGRRGRHWLSVPGANICCSMLWRFSKNDNLSGLSIAIAVMIVNVLKKYGISAGLQLKWPNDIFFEGRKLAGILLERSSDYVVIGIGVNLYLPEEADRAWISLQEILGRETLRNYLAGLLVNELLISLPIYQARGLKPFILDWQQHDVLVNHAITMQNLEQIYSGIMQGINDQGELLLKDSDNKIHSFCYGEATIQTRTIK